MVEPSRSRRSTYGNDKEEHFLYSEHITIYHIDLEKIRKKYYNKDKEIDRFEKEMLLLMETDKKVLSELSKRDETMEEAKKKLEDLSLKKIEEIQ